MIEAIRNLEGAAPKSSLAGLWRQSTPSPTNLCPARSGSGSLAEE